jgi:hypothetical protein
MQRDPRAELVDLCEQLTAATMDEQLEWKAEEEGAFTCVRRSGTILVRSVNGDGEAPFELVILNTDGVKVESLVSERSAEEELSSWNGAVAKLHRVARRQALNLDRLVPDVPPVEKDA